MTTPKTIVKLHYNHRKYRKAVFMRDGLLNQIGQRWPDKIDIITDRVTLLRNGPFAVEYEKLSYKIAADLYVLWDAEFYFLYRTHMPSTGPFSSHKWVVHILDIDRYRLDGDGNRILHLYEDPDAIRTIAERDGKIVTSSE